MRMPETPLEELHSRWSLTRIEDADLGLIYVNASDGLARAQGVRPGALVSTVAGKDMSSLKLEQVRDVLLKALKRTDLLQF